jgi:hypothetical protein
VRARGTQTRAHTLVQPKPQFWVVLGPQVSKLTLKSQTNLTSARFDSSTLSTTLSYSSFPCHWPYSHLDHSLTDKKMAHLSQLTLSRTRVLAPSEGGRSRAVRGRRATRRLRARGTTREARATTPSILEDHSATAAREFSRTDQSWRTLGISTCRHLWS